jgi:hypothetical protein
MNKRTAFLIAAALLAVGLFGATQAYAQEPDPVTPPAPGMGPGGFGPDNPGPGGGLLHEYMTAAMSEVFGISAEELDAIHESGTILFEALDLTVEEFRAKMAEVRQIALEQAAADGVISQDRADWMADRMNGAGQGQFGPGSGPCLDGEGPHGPAHGGRHGRGMGRW